MLVKYGLVKIFQNKHDIHIITLIIYLNKLN